MNINTVIEYENNIKKQVAKKAMGAIAICLVSCTLMFLLQRYAGLLIPAVEGEIPNLMRDIALYFVYVGIPFLFAKILFSFINKKSFKDVPKRLSPKKPAFYIFGAVGAGYLLNLAISMLFSDFVEQYGAEPMVAPESPLGVALFYLQVAIIPAFLEEWAFRGVILKNLLPYSKGGAIIISSLLFGIAHFDLPRIIFATFFGMLLAICYEYTNSLFLTIIIHFINNFMSVTATVFMDNMIIVMLIGFMMIGLMICAIIALIYYYKNGLNTKNVSFAKPNTLGYKLSTKDCMLRFVLNPAIIPYMGVFIYYLIIIYSY